MKNFGNIIKDERINQNMSVKILAEKTGCTERVIHYYERQERLPSIYMADKLLRVLGIELVIGKKRNGSP